MNFVTDTITVCEGVKWENDEIISMDREYRFIDGKLVQINDTIEGKPND